MGKEKNKTPKRRRGRPPKKRNRISQSETSKNNSENDKIDKIDENNNNKKLQLIEIEKLLFECAKPVVNAMRHTKEADELLKGTIGDCMKVIEKHFNDKRKRFFVGSGIPLINSLKDINITKSGELAHILAGLRILQSQIEFEAGLLEQEDIVLCSFDDVESEPAIDDRSILAKEERVAKALQDVISRLNTE